MSLERLVRKQGMAVFIGEAEQDSASQTAQLANDRQIIDAIFTVLRILIGVAVALSTFLIFNTISALLSEQMAIIGTMKALGGTRGVILRGYLTTVAIYGVIATIPALALGVLSGALMAEALAPQIPLYLGPFSISGVQLAPGTVVGLGVPLASRLDPKLSHEGLTHEIAVSCAYR